jgi:hypothetical protein
MVQRQAQLGDHNDAQADDGFGGTARIAESIQLDRACPQLLPSAGAAVRGMKYEELMRDPDFTRAVRSIAQECKVNVDLGALKC